MTCIVVGRLHNKKLCFVSERRVASGSHSYRNPTPKVKKKDGVILGGAGSGFVCAVVLESFVVPRPDPKDEQPLTYMFNRFYPELVKFLRKHKILMQDENRVNTLDGPNQEEIGLLVGYKGKLFNFEADNVSLHFDEAPLPFASGCGAPFALGALEALRQDKTSTVTRVTQLEIAIRSAAKLSMYCDANLDWTFED